MLLVSTIANADVIEPSEANGNIGNYATVEGVVSQVSKSSSGTTFINFGGRFPNHVFYAVIFRKRASLFPGIRNIEGKRVAISGEIERYKGKPQIILVSPEQIELR